MIGRWRSHVHVSALARIPEEQWELLFDVLADAAHELDEEVTCSGSLNQWPSCPIGEFDVQGFRMRPAAAEALHERVALALRGYEPAPAETHTILRPRCRCI